jgi:hypothetical protein
VNTPVPELAPLVNTPSEELDWLFTQPRQIPAQCDPQDTDEACSERMTRYLNTVAEEVINFFFVPPADGMRSRGELFGFRKELPREARDMMLFLVEQAEANLRQYCSLITHRLKLVLAMTH